MEILLGFIFGAVVGLAAHYTAPGRESRGTLLAPIIGALASGVVWMILTWAGIRTDNPWLWVSAVVVPALVVYPVLIVLARARKAHDERERIRLKLS